MKTKKTNWKEIQQLYAILAQIKPGPVVDLNQAIAIGYGESPAAGLNALSEIKELQHHYLYHAAKGDFLSELGDIEQARSSYNSALNLTTSKTEKTLLHKKLISLGIATE